MSSKLLQLNHEIEACQRCPRLIKHCQAVAKEKRKAYIDWEYHGKPVENFLPRRAKAARLLIVGLAPGAHGANRTGRMFTGDRSGDFLFEAMHQAGFANQAEASSREDGLKLKDCLITAAAHCAPPGNKPTRDELANCQAFLAETLRLLPRVQVILCLGKLALDAVLRLWRDQGEAIRMADYPFAHATKLHVPGKPTLLCSFHPSQQNTFTKRLTMPMLVKVFEQARLEIEKRGD